MKKFSLTAALALVVALGMTGCESQPATDAASGAAPIAAPEKPKETLTKSGQKMQPPPPGFAPPR